MESFENREQILKYTISNRQIYESYKFAIQGTTTSKIDVVFIIDDSGSMATPIANVRAGIPQFVAQLRADPTNRPFDYHVAITTSDPHGLTNDTATSPGTVYRSAGGIAGTFYGDPANPAGHAYFSRNMDSACSSNCSDYASNAAEDAGFQAAVNSVSILGHGDERVGAVMRYLMQDYLVNGNTQNGFFRSDSFKFFILITDEDECGQGAANGARSSTRVTPLTSTAATAGAAGFTYNASHPIASVRSTSHNSFCNYFWDHPAEIYNAIQAAGQDMSKFRLYAMVNEVGGTLAGETRSNFISDAVEKFGGSLSEIGRIHWPAADPGPLAPSSTAVSNAVLTAPATLAVTNVTLNGSNNFVFTVASSTGYSVGMRFNVTGVNGAVNANGNWTVRSTTGTSITAGETMASLGGAYTSGGSLSSLLSVNVTGTSRNASNSLVLTVGSTTGYSVGKRFTVAGVGGSTEANGTWTIQSLTPTTITTVETFPTLGTFSGGGTASLLRPLLLTVASTTGYSVGQKINVSGITGATEANGTWTIAATTGTTITTLETLPSLSTYTTGGSVSGLRINVTGVTKDASNQLVFTAASTTGYTAGMKFVAASIVGATEANSTWTVKSVTATTITTTETLTTLSTYSSGGTITPVDVDSYAEFLNALGQSVVTYASSFSTPPVSSTSNLPSSAALIQLYYGDATSSGGYSAGTLIPGPAPAAGALYTATVGASNVTINLTDATLKSAVSGKDLVLRWRAEPGLNKTFALPTVPDLTTLKIYFQGNQLTSSDYSFDSTKNEITLNVSVVFGDEITVTYFTQKGATP
ncbi:MAG: hypothetical protein JNL01_02825 [Bdellovibrionales bacterium]|nr:hypothetical protein [Bdellovibrionales bacterium]